MKILVKIAVFLLISFASLKLQAETITLSGRLLDPLQQPVSSNAVAFKVYLYDPTENCLLYSEDHGSLDMSHSNGNFELKMGAGTLMAGSPLASLRQALDNRIPFSGLTSCTTGTTYTPSATDSRKVRISFLISGTTQTLSSIEINQVANAIHSQTVGGFNAESLFRVSDLGNLGSISPFSSSQYNELFSLSNGTSTQFTKAGQLNGSNLPTMSPGNFLQWNGSNWVSASGPTESDPTVQSFAKTSLPYCSAGNALNSNGTSFSCVSTGTNGAASGDLLGNYPGPIVNRVQGVAVSTTTPQAGQTLTLIGTEWTPTYFNMNNLKTSLGASQMPVTPCTSSQTLSWSALTDSFSCGSISIDASAISTGNLDIGRMPTTIQGFATNFSPSVYTTTPNATVHAVQLLTIGSATNVDLAITPKGYGALTAQVADNATTGGNKRGGYAVDWQTSRSLANQVASSSYGVISGGANNRVSGNYSVVSGGNSNFASGDTSTVGGGLNNSAGSTGTTVSGGSNNTTPNSAYYATISGGADNSVNAGEYGTIAGGKSNLVSGQYGFATNLNSTSDAYAMSVFGQYNVLSAGSKTAWVATDPLFVIGNGTGTGARSNALTILKNGSINVSGDVTPANDNAINLGSSAKRWKEIFVYNSVLNTSDLRLKKDIEESELGLDFINALRAVSWSWKNAGQGESRHYGIIAQETQNALKRLLPSERSDVIVNYDSQSDQFSVRYTELIAPLIKAIQELSSQLHTVQSHNETEIYRLNNENFLKNQKIQSLEKRLEALENLHK